MQKWIWNGIELTDEKIKESKKLFPNGAIAKEAKLVCFCECPNCDKTFDPPKTGHRPKLYCSPKCQVKAWRLAHK